MMRGVSHVFAATKQLTKKEEVLLVPSAIFLRCQFTKVQSSGVPLIFCCGFHSFPSNSKWLPHNKNFVSFRKNSAKMVSTKYIGTLWVLYFKKYHTVPRCAKYHAEQYICNLASYSSSVSCECAVQVLVFKPPLSGTIRVKK